MIKASRQFPRARKDPNGDGRSRYQTRAQTSRAALFAKTVILAMRRPGRALWTAVVPRLNGQVCIVLHVMVFVRRSGTGVAGLRMGQSWCARGQPNRQGNNKNFP